MPGSKRRDSSFHGDPEWRRFADKALDELVPMMDKSAFAVSIVPRKPENYSDVQWCIELGLMIMLDKPIIAIIEPGTKVPNKLILVADAIIEIHPDDPDYARKVSLELKVTMDRLDKERGQSDSGEGPAADDDEGQPG